MLAVSKAGLPARREATTMRSLLESERFANVASSNIVKTKGASDISTVRKVVSDGLKDITSDMRVQQPETFKQVDTIELSPEQESKVLAAVSCMSDPRVQDIGREVAQVVKAGMGGGVREVKRQLLEKFQSRKQEILELRQELFPDMVRIKMKDSRLFQDLSHAGDADGSRRLDQPSWPATWGSTMLDAEAAGFNGTLLDPSMSDGNVETWALKFEKALGIIAGLLEQTRVALTQVKFVGGAFGKDMKIPFWATSLVGGLAFVSQLIDCLMRADANEVKRYMCPMKYASAAADFFAAFDDIFYILTGSTTGAPLLSGDMMASDLFTPSPAPAVGWSWSR